MLLTYYFTSTYFYTFFLESFNLWRPLLMIALYHQTKTPISFWCRQGLNPKFLIQPSEILPVELTKTHNYLGSWPCTWVTWANLKSWSFWNTPVRIFEIITSGENNPNRALDTILESHSMFKCHLNNVCVKLKNLMNFYEPHKLCCFYFNNFILRRVHVPLNNLRILYDTFSFSFLK